MSWAEVKKINSDMNKPLDDLLDEQISSYIGNNDLIQGGNSIKTLLGNLWNSMQSKFGKFIGTYTISKVTSSEGQMVNSGSIVINGRGKASINLVALNRKYDIKSMTADLCTINVDGNNIILYPKPTLTSSASNSRGLFMYIFGQDFSFFFDRSFSMVLTGTTNNNIYANYKIDLFA